MLRFLGKPVLGLIVLILFVKNQPVQAREGAVSFNGVFLSMPSNPDYSVWSGNQRYGAQYDVTAVTDEIRILENLRLYEHGRLICTMKIVPGSDLMISNSGVMVFMDHARHDRGELTLHFVDRRGRLLLSDTFHGACLFGFSVSGNRFGVGDRSGFHVLYPETGARLLLPKADRFDFDAGGDAVVLTRESTLSVYRNGRLTGSIKLDSQFIRRVRWSKDGKRIGVIDKHGFTIYDGESFETKGELALSEPLSFRDLRAAESGWEAGVHERTETVSQGFVYRFDSSGFLLEQIHGARRDLPSVRRPDGKSLKKGEEDALPWMFQPFDQMPTVWNYYEQHMGAGTYTYLHQGLDLIVPENEPTYAVEDGFVKCVLTLGGEKYWRLAVSPIQTVGVSDGWLYAHLVEGSIQVDVGDAVSRYDYLGDIVQWYQDWGHIHFVNIRDHGLIWRYDDGEWGINFNPLLVMAPDSDFTAPVFSSVRPGRKMLFTNNMNWSYLDPDSLWGDVDLIVKLHDYVGDSPWQQPAYETYYWVRSLPDRALIFPRTTGHRLNHAYPFYASSWYTPYARILYREDDNLRASSWMSLNRNYYHILTHDDGDTCLTLQEEDRAFATADYPDGPYRFYVEARDEWGNSSTDSMDVVFRNGITSVQADNTGMEPVFRLEQNVPNPFNAETRMDYYLSRPARVRIGLYDMTGRRVALLDEGLRPAGTHRVRYRGDHLPSGVYVCRFESGTRVEVRKWILMR